ncbi:rho-associated protein kinase 2-like [Saccoglossus kowalevskii]
MLDSGPDRLTNPSRQSDARRQLDNSYKERERVHRKISVHRKMELRQAEQQLQRVDEQRKTSEEKVKQLTLQLEQEAQRRTLITNDYKSVSQEVAKLRLSEKQYKKEQTELKELLKSQDEKVEKIKHNLALNELQMKELQDQFEAEQYFSTLYKKQVRELKEEVDERANQMQDVQDTVNKLQNARDSLMAQLELTLTKADSEQLARAIAQGQYDDLEKEKTMLEMEMEQMRLTHKSEMNEKNSIITMLEQEKNQLEERKHHLSDTMDNLVSEKNELNKKLKEAMEDNNSLKNETETIELIKKDHEKTLQQEKTLKIQAYQEEYQKKMQLQMELDSKDSEIEQISFKLQALNSDTASINSGMDLDSEEGITDSSRVEGWLALPNRQNIKRYGWKKQYVVVSSRKILFYNDEGEKQASNPEMVLDIDKLYHVRSVTQGDVIRADAKDIPRIFQLLYAGEGESKKERDNAQDLPPILDKEMIQFKNHEFLTVHFHMPTGCESCRKPLGGIIKPPTALECRRCHMKVHKDHYDKKEEVIPPCKVNFDVNTAKNLLLLASCSEDQQQWVHRLSKKVIKKPMTPCTGSPSKSLPRQQSKDNNQSSYFSLRRTSSSKLAAQQP